MSNNTVLHEFFLEILTFANYVLYKMEVKEMLLEKALSSVLLLSFKKK